MKTYILIDIGGTAIKYGLMDEREKLIFKDKTPTESKKGGPYIQQKVMRIVQLLLDKMREEGGESAGVAISSAGMVDVENGYIFHSGPTIPGYKGTQFKTPIEASFGIPCEIENDVNCAGLAEYISGAGKGVSSMLCLTIGTGIGGCAVLQGEVLHGFTGSACEVGYMHMGRLSFFGTGAGLQEQKSSGDSSGLHETKEDGLQDSFEGYGSASALTRHVAKVKKDDPQHWDGLHIFAAAKQGDPDCVQAIEEMCDVLGRGIANICYVLNPEIVVLGGGIMAQKDYLYPRIRVAMDHYLIPVLAQNTKLAMAQQGNDAGMIGAYYHFRQMQEKRRMPCK